MVSNKGTSFSKQFNALLRKSLSFQRRQYKTNVCQAVIPILMVSIMAILQAATSGDPVIANLSPVNSPPPVSINPEKFSTQVYYTIGDVEGIQIGNCCGSNSSGFLGGFTNSIEESDISPEYITLGLIPTAAFQFDELPSKQVLDDTMYRGFGTNWIIAYLFNVMKFPYEFSFTAIHNDTEGVPAYINLIDNALFRSLTEDENATITTRLKEFPVQGGTKKNDVIQGQENFWYLFMLSFSMIIFVQNIVYEKEHRLREAMKMAGLKMSVYWLVTYLFDLLLFIMIALVLVIFGNILRFRFFTQTDASVYIVLFLLFGLSSISLSFLFSSLLSKDQTSSIVAFIYVMFISLTANIMNNSFLGNPQTPWAAYVVTAIVPHFAFHRAVSFISNNYADNQGFFTWENVKNHDQLPLLYGFLAMTAVAFLLIHQYLEAVIPTTYGTSLSPIFFLKPSFWRSVFRKSTPQHSASTSNINNTENSINSSGINNSDPIIVRSQSVGHKVEMDPPDVATERAMTLDPSNRDSIKILQLSKTFRSSGRRIDAVNKLTLSVKQGQCFGLLGPNGSGKSTTLNIISGLYTPSSGTCVVQDYNIKTDLAMAQLSLGVCPQDDVLWGELTGREHLLFFGRLKNYTGAELEKLVNDSLEEVLLTDAQHKQAKSYSGGMKRRLSLGISLIGSPKAVVLDEPTTGVDPFSRRIVWDVIRSYKNKCAIILTTHSMEEADILCDRVCIIDHGTMKCIGQTAELKNRYGAGYSLTITGNAPVSSSSSSLQPESDAINEFIQELIPGSILVNSLAGTRSFAVPRAAVKLSVLFRRIEESKIQLGITDWGITLSNLEEVLLQTCKHEDS
eukprot:TRINITY_DN1223_c0_g1_i2.p1 TRINITY_DN1223_c0_g1~~TRINITY_DN1223_c0_g1_i2.p1  ORF type:complete len:847 (-),score=170.51 TRINITY_DN1223_c0_g1_i2:138-2678(-)